MKVKNGLHWLVSASFSLLFFACSKDPMQKFEDSKRELHEMEELNFRQTGIYPNPMGSLDTLHATVNTRKNPNAILGYDFLINAEENDLVYESGEFKMVNHPKREVTIFSSNQLRERDENILNNRYIQYSPLTLLNLENWDYDGDTSIHTKIFSVYKRVDLDTIINENNVLTEFLIFLPEASNFPERFERRNYYKGELSQTVVYEYEQVPKGDFDQEAPYSIPSNFISVFYGTPDPDLRVLHKGDKAPEFEGFDLNNQWLETADFEGEQLLLMFSAINCGYCKLAMEYLTEENTRLSDKVRLINFYPVDNKDPVIRYMNKFNPSFPVVANAEAIEKAYGVNGYPTFFLINAQGEIEEVHQGFDPKFLEKYVH